MKYIVFTRSVTTWEQFSKARKYVIAENVQTFDEAKEICRDFNEKRSKAQIRKGTKAEFTSQDWRK